MAKDAADGSAIPPAAGMALGRERELRVLARWFGGWPHVLVRLRVLSRRAFRDRQACHWLTSSPVSLRELAWSKKGMLDRRAATAAGKVG